MNDPEQLPPLEKGLRDCLRALDNQIARELQRSPSELATQGVQKWQPIQTRVERLSAFLLSELGEDSVNIESVLVLAQASTKALRMACEDLGKDGLGKVRAAYCVSTFDSVSNDSRVALDLMRETTPLS
jgi:Asp-tRNA(Asn)/Glu-tRNA(Gln) amidotransferase A subunit family amidase